MASRRVVRITLVSLLFVITAGYGVNGYPADVAFRWAILADNGRGMEPLDFSGMPVINSGTPMQFYLEHLDNCYIYLYLYDAGNHLAALYPMNSGYYNYGFPRGQKYFPPGDHTFSFVPPGGTETFIIVATATRPMQLEKLTNELLDNPNSEQQQQLLLGEIERVIGKREKKSLKKEDPVQVERRKKTADGVATTTFTATEVDGDEIYGRRLLIDHR